VPITPARGDVQVMSDKLQFVVVCESDAAEVSDKLKFVGLNAGGMKCL
jgi:hypothetical protein